MNIIQFFSCELQSVLCIWGEVSSLRRTLWFCRLNSLPIIIQVAWNNCKKDTNFFHRQIYCDSKISILDISAKVTKSGTERGLSTAVVITALLRAGQAWEPTGPLADERLHKIWCVCRRKYWVLWKRELLTHSAACMTPGDFVLNGLRQWQWATTWPFYPHIQVTWCNGLWKSGKSFTQVLEP